MNFRPKKITLLTLVHSLGLNGREGLHTSRHVLERNFYEVLNLKKSCSPKEIKESFIHLAKKHHPDTNMNDAGSHKRFIELQNAYSVLSSPSKRQEYDLNLTSGYNPNLYRRSQRGGTQDEYDVEFSEEFKKYYYRSRTTYEDTSSLKRVGTFRIITIFVAFITLGALAQFYIIKWLYKRNYDDEMERHEKASASYHALKHEMEKRTEDYDIKKLRNAYFKEIGHGAVAIHLVPSLVWSGKSEDSERTISRKKEQNDK